MACARLGTAAFAFDSVPCPRTMLPSTLVAWIQFFSFRTSPVPPPPALLVLSVGPAASASASSSSSGVSSLPPAQRAVQSADALLESEMKVLKNALVSVGFAALVVYALLAWAVQARGSSPWSDRESGASRNMLDPSVTVWDSTKCGKGFVLTNHNSTLKRDMDGSFQTCLGNRTVTQGRWRWDVRIDSVSLDGDVFLGVAHRSVDVNGPGAFRTDKGWMYHNNGGLWHHNVRTPEIITYGEGDVIGLLLDFHSRTLSLFKNGLPLGIAFRNLQGEFSPAVDVYGVGTSVTIQEVPARGYAGLTGFIPEWD